MSKRNSNKPFFLYLGIFMLGLCIISNSMLGGMFARYVTKDSNKDSARVAKFEIVDDGLYSDVTVLRVTAKPDAEHAFYYDVTNKSEVSVRVIVTSTNLTNNLPLKIVVEGAEGKFFTDENSKVIIEFVVGETQRIKIGFAWSTDSENDLPYNSPEYAGMIYMVKISVVVEQKN